jgi:Septin
LKPLDIEFMKQLHDKVNIIPVIAKADTLTEEEIAFFKAQVHTVFLAWLRMPSRELEVKNSVPTGTATGIGKFGNPQ